MRAISGLLIAAAAVVVAACSSSSSEPVTTLPADITTTTFATALNVNLAAMTKTADGLYYRDSIVGTGTAAQFGGTATVNYIGWLPGGFLFGSSAIDTQPYTFTLGLRQAITGFEEGITGMNVGGWRKLVIPPSLAYGDRGNGVVPGNAILVFNVQLLGLK